MANWKMFLIVLAAFLVLDFVWLGLLMKNFYNAELGELARRQGNALAPRWGAAALVYVLIPAGVVLFVRPLLGDQTTYAQAFGWGALFGVVVYGVYDLTNLAVLEKWTVRMTMIDIVWGGVLCGTMATLMRVVDRLTK